MKKTMILFAGICLYMMAGCNKQASVDTNTPNTQEADKPMQIVVEGANTQSIVFQLNTSQAAQALYEQLPLTLEVEDYQGNEKIFYPDQKLDTSDAMPAEGPIGTLAYYEPWGNVVMYYGDCHGASGLYGLGEAVSGTDQIVQLSGSITIRRMEDTQNQKEKPQAGEANIEEEHDQMHHLNILIGETSFSASLYDTESVRAWMDQLPMTLMMEDLHRNEKYYYFPDALPTSAQAVSQIHTGDIKLYGSDCLVLFYKDFPTSFSYTSLGQIDDPQGLADAVGTGSVTIRFEKAEYGSQHMP